MAVYLRKKHLSRRTMLRGGVVALGLPFLDAMVPAATALAQTAAAPKIRTGFFYIPHGAIMNNTPFGKDVDAWTSTGKGADFQLGHILQPLDFHKDYVTTFENLENVVALGSVHTLNPATWLSCVRPDTGAKGASMAVTLDQVIAQNIGQSTALPSLEICSETTIQVAAGGGFYSSTLSFRAANAPQPMEYNPRKVFVKLLGEGDTAAEREALTRKTGSLLDMIADRTDTLRAELGAQDRRTLSEYLDTVREIERRVDMAGDRNFSAYDVPEAPVGELEAFDEQVRLQFDLLALAYQADLTRVATFLMVSEGTNRTYNHIGVPDSFHPVSHHTNDPERIRKLTLIQRYHAERFADFVTKLAATPDGEGSMLDNSLFLYGSNMSNSNQHDNYPLPNILVGKAGGAVRGGQNITLPERTPLANVHLSVLNKLGIEQTSFGNSTGVISDI